jgi:hypothetical protein
MKATKRHEDFRLAVVDAMRPFDDIPPIEQLAVLSGLLGQLIALQDSTKYTAARVADMVAANIEEGNANALTAAAMGKLRP